MHMDKSQIKIVNERNKAHNICHYIIYVENLKHNVICLWICAQRFQVKNHARNKTWVSGGRRKDEVATDIAVVLYLKKHKNKTFLSF